MILRTIARPLLASAFVVSGIDALRARPATVDTAQPLVDAGRDALPAEVAAGQQVQVGSFGRWLDASVVEEPVYDPTGARMRADAESSP